MEQGLLFSNVLMTPINVISKNGIYYDETALLSIQQQIMNNRTFVYFDCNSGNDLTKSVGWISNVILDKEGLKVTVTSLMTTAGNIAYSLKNEFVPGIAVSATTTNHGAFERIINPILEFVYLVKKSESQWDDVIPL